MSEIWPNAGRLGYIVAALAVLASLTCYAGNGRSH